MENFKSFINSFLNLTRKLNLFIAVILGILFFIITCIYLKSDLPLRDALASLFILFVIFAIILFSLYLQNTRTKVVQSLQLMSKKERIIYLFSRYGKNLLFISVLYLIFETIPLLYKNSQTQGVVLQSETIQESKNSSMTCNKMIEYHVNNKSYTTSDSYMLSPLGTCEPKGAKLIVSFNSSHPEVASSLTLYERFFLPFVLLILANILMLIGWLAKYAKE